MRWHTLQLVLAWIIGGALPVAAGIEIPAEPIVPVPEGMVLIPGGTFRMGTDWEELAELEEMGRKVPHMSLTHAEWWFGDETPRHEVPVKPFFLDAREVTNAEFRLFLEVTGYEPEGPWEKYGRKDKRSDHPVVNVSWRDAEAYAGWAGKRLPTEAEWEYAAVGGADHRWFPWGGSIDRTRANYRHQGENFFQGLWRLMGFRRMGTEPVGSYEPNGYGLVDMIGNVSEWVDAVHEDYPGGPGKEWMYAKFGPFTKNPEPRHGMVVRGGGWENSNPVFVRMRDRKGAPEGSWSWARGFRCAKTVEL